MTTADRPVSFKPILFSGEMVRAILSGRKTQTRRVAKWTIRGLVRLRSPYAAHARDGIGLVWSPYGGAPEQPMPGEKVGEVSPYGGPGSRLWVRETWAEGPSGPVYRADFDVSDGFGTDVVEIATGRMAPLRWRPSIHMPRRHSRLTLEIGEVRFERLQDITEADAVAEGVQAIPSAPASLTDRTAFAKLWDSINGRRGLGWATNPWVWTIGFTPVPAPVGSTNA